MSLDSHSGISSGAPEQEKSREDQPSSIMSHVEWDIINWYRSNIVPDSQVDLGDWPVRRGVFVCFVCFVGSPALLGLLSL